MLTDRYKHALVFAAEVHEGHTRKQTDIAYLAHLISVSALVMEHGGSETEAIAALLHDSIEDRGDEYVSRFHVPPLRGRPALKRDIEYLFGREVLGIVLDCTDDEYLPQREPAQKGTVEEWLLRKETFLEQLRRSSALDSLRVSCADKLHNARSLLSDYELEGESIWRLFRTGNKADQVWYYGSSAEIFSVRAAALDDPGLRRMAGEIAAIVERIEAMDVAD